MRRRKLLASQSALHELRNQTVCFCPVPSAHPCTHSVRIHASTSTQFKSKRKNGVARMHTVHFLWKRLGDVRRVW
jgi:hypothetical protein